MPLALVLQSPGQAGRAAMVSDPLNTPVLRPLPHCPRGPRMEAGPLVPARVVPTTNPHYGKMAPLRLLPMSLWNPGPVVSNLEPIPTDHSGPQAYTSLPAASASRNSPWGRDWGGNICCQTHLGSNTVSAICQLILLGWFHPSEFGLITCKMGDKLSGSL